MCCFLGQRAGDLLLVLGQMLRTGSLEEVEQAVNCFVGQRVGRRGHPSFFGLRSRTSATEMALFVISGASRVASVSAGLSRNGSYRPIRRLAVVDGRGSVRRRGSIAALEVGLHHPVSLILAANSRANAIAEAEQSPVHRHCDRAVGGSQPLEETVVQSPVRGLPHRCPVVLVADICPGTCGSAKPVRARLGGVPEMSGGGYGVGVGVLSWVALSGCGWQVGFRWVVPWACERGLSAVVASRFSLMGWRSAREPPGELTRCGSRYPA